MIVLVKDIPAYAFSSGLNELVFATDQNTAVLSLTVGEKEILSETYIPDASGRITINDLQGLIEPYLATNLIERCSSVLRSPPCRLRILWRAIFCPR